MVGGVLMMMMMIKMVMQVLKMKVMVMVLVLFTCLACAASSSSNPTVHSSTPLQSNSHFLTSQEKITMDNGKTMSTIAGSIPHIVIAVVIAALFSTVWEVRVVTHKCM